MIKRLVRENPQLLVGGVLIGLLFLACLVGMFYPYDPIIARGQAPPHQLPSWRYWLGTDQAGQGILIQVIEGTEAFFAPGVFATLIALCGGLLLGALSGYYGGIFAMGSRYLNALINSFPNLILVLLCVAVFGTNMYLIAAVVGVTFMPHIGEEIRRKVAQFKAEEFIMAAEAHGLRDRRILFYHIVWLHCLPLILRQLVFLWGYLVILESSLSYLARGVLHKGISWGKLLYEYRSGLFRGHLWSPFVLTFVLLITMAGFFLLAEGLQRVSDERARGGTGAV